MKKIKFYLFVLFLSLQLQAQLTNGNFTTEVDYRLQNISKTPITSNILIDRVFPVAALQEFNQGSRIDTSSYTHFKQAWSELYRASYIKNFSALAQLKQQVTTKNYNNSTVPIGIINTEFHQGNYGTTSQNATVNFDPSTSLFSNKPNINPFIKKQTTVIAPLVAKVFGNTINFTTDPLFHLQKQGKTIKNLQIQTNGSTFQLINNYVIQSGANISYTTSGLKNLHFTITYNDNSTKQTHAKIYVHVPTNYQARGNISPLTEIVANTDLAFQGYDENQAISGKNKYKIYYNGDNILDKPIVIIDGYDPGDLRKIDPQSDGYNKESSSIYELMSYDDDNNESTPNKDLVNELNTLGYDVVIVNHHVYDSGGFEIDGGSDYIERNAFTLISLLRHINATKVGTEQNVIIGPSMGGLISRYALAYMEKQFALTGNNTKWNHDTRLWVSFDSPHQGANIPIGVQKGIQFFADDFGVESAKDFINEQLSKPAPKQMLVNHFTNDTNLPVGAPYFRDRFQSDLDNLGMPQNLRKVALVNGSITGELNGISSAKYLEVDADIDTVIALPFFGLGGLGAILTIGANIFADSMLGNFYHTTNSKSGTQESFTFDGGLRGKFLWWEWWTTRTNYKSKPKSKGSYDIAPGGNFYAQQLLADESTSNEQFIYVLVNVFIGTGATVIDPTHSFIPTKSALAYQGSSILDENIGGINMVCSGNTPFDNYFAPENNEEHITLTSTNVAWLLEELNGTPQLPIVYKSFDISSLTGDTAVCNNKTNIYNLDIPNSCSGYTINWTTSSNIQIQAHTNNSLIVTPINGTTDAVGYVNAYIQELDLHLHRKVWVGIPSPDFLHITKIGSYQFYANQWTKLKVEHLMPPVELMGSNGYGLSYQWSVPNSQIRTFTDTSMIDVNPFATGQLNIGVKMQNQCGCTNYKYQLFNVTQQSSGGGGGGHTIRPIGN
ncbi:hypothetical protein [Polaribacter aestuariivivens]|uniref:hypothetical protein n=1 Tax=Polaribacter aestuariivivens TaxID=2304626 RepID=UPI003F49156A